MIVDPGRARAGELLGLEQIADTGARHDDAADAVPAQLDAQAAAVKVALGRCVAAVSGV